MTETPRYRDRFEAGRELAALLGHLRGRDPLVLALPRGGVPVARPISEQLGAPLDVMLVRKLGVPGHEEYAMGAIAEGGRRVLNKDVIRQMRIEEDVINRVAEREQQELARRGRLFRGDRPAADVAGRCVILVDDGLATGATMKAAAEAVRLHHPKYVVVAVPVGSVQAVESLSSAADEVVCPRQPEPFTAVGRWYENFDQVSDQQVQQDLAAAARGRRSD